MSNERKVDDLFSPVYAKRQFVVVFPDQFFEPNENGRNGSEMISLTGAAKLASDVLIRGFVPSVVGLAIQAAREGWEAYRKARESGLDALPIKLTDAAFLSFPPGHPQIGRLYVLIIDFSREFATISGVKRHFVAVNEVHTFHNTFMRV